ncbi:uncharacterized protein redic1 isoform X11 [Scleropages formosus]|uniref:uncharacterized protein redic1 isoform X11 n=1 Tax=Scleropages formosus TaxID=113540 RepID=UPI0010FAAA05|nr:uncharacterized protein C12orf40 homolog isoform X11 [Scleropages formosus]
MSPDALYAVHLEGAELLRKAKERENPFQVEMKPDVSRGSQAVRARMLRNRLMIKNDARKQKEFFEKKRVEKKMQDLGLPGAPQGQSGGSLDLLTLFIVNQIAAKKEQHSSIKHDTPKVAHANKAKRVQRSIKEGPINLPMSPCSPSRLCLGESQPHYGTQGTVLKSSNFRPQTQSYGHLSPVLESSFSDGSISDYQCHPADTLSPFSLTASDSSSGVFNLQHRPELKQRRDTVTASRGSQHIQNSSVTRVQFGSMESNYLGGRGLALQTSVGHRSFIHETGENLEQMLFLDFDDRAGHFESENFETNIKGKSSPYSAVFCRCLKAHSHLNHHAGDTAVELQAILPKETSLVQIQMMKTSARGKVSHGERPTLQTPPPAYCLQSAYTGRLKALRMMYYSSTQERS